MTARTSRTSSLGQGTLDQPDLFDELDALGPGLTEDTAQASIDALLSTAGHYRSPQAYRELIRFVGKLPRYKPFNRMLVHLQDPGARYVATAARWESEFRRRVRAGARPLIVMQPRGPVLVVFDVRDTEPLDSDAPPLPVEATDPLAIRLAVGPVDLARRWHHLEHNAIRDGVRITLADHGGHSGGFLTTVVAPGVVVSRPRRLGATQAEDGWEVFPLRYELVVNRNLSDKDRYATLVHELAHLYCGHLGSPDTDQWPDRPRLTHAADEVEAESVVHMILARIDPGVAMGDYIQGHLDEQGQVPPQVSLNAMMKAAGLIEEMGDKRMPARKPKRSGRT